MLVRPSPLMPVTLVHPGCQPSIITPPVASSLPSIARIWRCEIGHPCPNPTGQSGLSYLPCSIPDIKTEHSTASKTSYAGRLGCSGGGDAGSVPESSSFSKSKQTGDQKPRTQEEQKQLQTEAEQRAIPPREGLRGTPSGRGALAEETAEHRLGVTREILGAASSKEGGRGSWAKPCRAQLLRLGTFFLSLFFKSVPMFLIFSLLFL